MVQVRARVCGGVAGFAGLCGRHARCDVSAREVLRAMNANAAHARSEKEARRIQIMKRILEVLGWLTAFAILAFASHSVFAAGGGQQQQQQQNINITVRPAQTVEERVADETKEK